MTNEATDNTDRQTHRDEVTDLIVRGVFAFTLALAAVGAQLAAKRRDWLDRQDPHLN